MAPDLTFQVLPTDYAAALAADGARWEAPTSDRRPTWNGRRAWTLLKGTTERALWRLFAFAGERVHQEQEKAQTETTALVVSAVTGCGFRTADEMVTLACQRLVEQSGRALRADEHERIHRAVRDLWALAGARETFEITEKGRKALEVAECVDCFAPALPGSSMMCALCAARHRTPDRSELRQAGAA